MATPDAQEDCGLRSPRDSGELTSALRGLRAVLGESGESRPRGPRSAVQAVGLAATSRVSQSTAVSRFYLLCTCVCFFKVHNLSSSMEIMGGSAEDVFN